MKLMLQILLVVAYILELLAGIFVIEKLGLKTNLLYVAFGAISGEFFIVLFVLIGLMEDKDE